MHDDHSTVSKLNRVCASAFPGLGLLGVYFYFWSNNVTYFTGTAVLASACLLALFGVAIFLLNYFPVWRLVEKVVKQKYQNVCHIIILSGIFSFFLAGFINYNISMPGWILGFGIFLAVTALCLFGMGKWLALFLLVFMGAECAHYAIKYGYLRYTENKILKNMDNLPEVPKLVHKPNIYVYWLESYQDFPMLEETFGMDVSQFRDFLLKNKFHIGENVYSSADYTLGALAQFYSASVIRERAVHRGDHNEAFWFFRDIIGGSKYNYVYRVLKENSYRTYLLFKRNQWYYMHTQGKYLDEVAFSRSFLDKFFTPIKSFLISPIKGYLNSIESKFNKNDYHIHGYEGSSVVGLLMRAMSRAKASGKPYIITIKGGADHTPPTYYSSENYRYSPENRHQWINSQFYQKLVIHSNKETEKIINYIITHDNNSIILLMGDHGPRTYLWGWNAASDNTLADDFFRVFFAWRMPNGLDDDLARGMYMNNANVFMHILAWMADDPKLLAKRETSETFLYWGKNKMVEGKIVSQ